jgi:hypothetical protein
MTHKQKTYVVLGAVILGVIALMLVLTNGRADAGEKYTPRTIPCRSTTTTTGLVEAEPEFELRRPPGSGLRPCVTTSTSTSTTSTSTTSTTTVTLSPSTTICRIGENGLGTYPNGEPCGAQTLRPVIVIAQPTYTG